MVKEYKLKLKHFIPFYGVAKYAKEVSSPECREQVDSIEDDNIGARLALLGFYHAALLIGSGVGIEKGLEWILK